MANDYFSALENVAWRLFYRGVYPMAKLYWLVRRKQHQGALVATYVGPDLLMLRSSYRRAWNFPGGGVKRHEEPEQAAKREFREEMGLIIPQLQSQGSIQGRFEGRRETVHFFELHLDEMPPIKIDNREIMEARLVTPAELANMELTRPVAAFLERQRSPIE